MLFLILMLMIVQVHADYHYIAKYKTKPNLYSDLNGVSWILFREKEIFILIGSMEMMMDLPLFIFVQFMKSYFPFSSDIIIIIIM